MDSKGQIVLTNPFFYKFSSYFEYHFHITILNITEVRRGSQVLFLLINSLYQNVLHGCCKLATILGLKTEQQTKQTKIPALLELKGIILRFQKANKVKSKLHR